MDALDGIHHVTCVTGDAPVNLAFYTGTLGLRLVKKSVNQDDPTVYHLFYADEDGSAGADITFFEYPGARRGTAGDGMIHTVAFRISSEDALRFWERRLSDAGVHVQCDTDALAFHDPEGLRLELRITSCPDRPLVAQHPEIPAEVALQGFDGVRAFATDPARSAALLGGLLGFAERAPGEWECRGATRGGRYGYDPPPTASPRPGSGTVHHVAWASPDHAHDAWQRRVAEAGLHPSPVIDRFWFRSVYFREPSGILFELATHGPGFGIDEDPSHLGETLILPPAFEHLRSQVERILTPLPASRRG